MKGSFEISIYALFPKAATVILAFLILKRTVLTPKMHLLVPKMHLLDHKMHLRAWSLRAGTLTGLGRFGQERLRAWSLEMDGTLVPTRVQDEQGFVCVEYREVKNAVLYEKNTPSERYQLSGIYTAEVFTILVLRLLRFARVSQVDRLVGLSDSAVWIANIFCNADVNYHILDVFHASSYFETLMIGLGWAEEQRMKERAALLRGEIDVFAWLNWNVTSSQRAGLKDEALKVFSYLAKQSDLLHTTIPSF